MIATPNAGGTPARPPAALRRPFAPNAWFGPLPSAVTAREMNRRLGQLDVPTSVEVESLTIPSGPGGQTSLRIFRPDGCTGPLPVVLYVHSDSSALGHRRIRRVAGKLTVSLDVAVVVVDHSVSPRQTHVMAIEAHNAVAEWVAEHGGEHGLDGSRIAVAADAAAVNLADDLVLMADQLNGPCLIARPLLALVQFAEAQTALRRIAILLAHGAPQAEVFEAVAAELRELVGAEGANIIRFEVDGTATVVAASGRSGAKLPVNSSVSLEGRTVSAVISRNGHAARMDSCADTPGPFASFVRQLGIRSAVGAPIFVDGHIWGVAAASMSREQSLAPDAEARLAEYTDLISTAIASTQASADLAASRARIVAAGDQARRQLERNLHDGILQQLTAIAIELGDTAASIPAELPDLRQRASAATHWLTSAVDDLREISRGIHPTILSDRGLPPALKGLARRSRAPVELNVHIDGRLAEPVEVAAYYVAAEALANANKHADASIIRINAAAGERWLDLSIADNGAGGADPARGSGLIGLIDRVDAMGGTIMINSPTGQGTELQIKLPLGSEH